MTFNELQTESRIRFFYYGNVWMERDFFDREKTSTEHDLKEILNRGENQKRLAYLLMDGQMMIILFFISPTFVKNLSRFANQETNNVRKRQISVTAR